MTTVEKIIDLVAIRTEFAARGAWAAAWASTPSKVYTKSTQEMIQAAVREALLAAYARWEEQR